jgi:hypothetical protein
VHGKGDVLSIQVGDQVGHPRSRLHVGVRQVSPQADRVLERLVVRLPVPTHREPGRDPGGDEADEHRPAQLPHHLPLVGRLLRWRPDPRDADDRSGCPAGYRPASVRRPRSDADAFTEGIRAQPSP